MAGIKSILKKSAVVRKLYGIVRYVKNRKIRKIQKNMKLNGVNTVFFIEKLLTDRVFFYMDMGTMLGIIREGRLLGHDLDIDVAVYVQNEEDKEAVKTMLLDAGCTVRYSYAVDSVGVVEQSFEFHDLKFDVNYYTREGQKDVCYLMYHEPSVNYTSENELSVVKLSVDAVTAVKKVPFCGGEVTVPENPERYLAQRYGENWRVPDKNYVYWQGPSTSKTNYKGFRTCGK